MKQAGQERGEPVRPGGCTWQRTAAAVVVFYCSAALLNAGALLREAQRLPYGNWRSVCVAMAEPLARAAGAVRLTVLRDGLEEALHGH